MTDKKTYYFSTYDFELAYNVLDIQPNQVYKTDEKGIYHLLKSIIDYPDDYFEYTLSRSEFAKRIGKSREAVRSAMRRGQYAECYRFDGSQYLFKEPSRSRVPKVDSHGQKAMHKRQVNRGNHHNVNYPNEAFRSYNQKKILEKLNKTDPGFVARVPELEKLYQQQKAERIRDQLNNTSTKNYGGFLSKDQLRRTDFEPTNRGPSLNKKTYY
jgi:hypothetical protein